MRILATSAALIVGLLGMGVSPAFAAKGVKKETADGVKHIHGVVLHVNHSDGKGKGKRKNANVNAGASGHIGSITIKEHHKKKKGQPAAAAQANVAGKPAVAGAKKGKKGERTFSVSKGTKFSIVKGKQHEAATFAAVHDGEHVSIVEKKGHAEVVDIHPHEKKKNA